MPIHLEFTLSFKDYQNAQWLHVSRISWRKILRYGSLYVYPICGIVLLVLSFAMESDPDSVGNTVFVGIVGIFLICYPLYYRYRLKKLYRRTRIDDGNRRLDFSDQGIHTESSNTKTDITWNAVQSFTENKHLFMLYLAPARFIAIPKHVCTAQQIDELRGLFLRHIRPKAS